MEVSVRHPCGHMVGGRTTPREAPVSWAQTACVASPGSCPACCQTSPTSLSLSKFQWKLWITFIWHLSSASLEFKKTFHLLVFLWSTNFLLLEKKQKKRKVKSNHMLPGTICTSFPPHPQCCCDWLLAFLYSGICAQAPFFCVVSILFGFSLLGFARFLFPKTSFYNIISYVCGSYPDNVIPW